MEYSLVVSPIAETQILEASIWYDERQADLGLDFTFAVENALLEIKNSPFLFATYSGNFRKRNVKRFPYLLIYEVRVESIIVLALLHHSRDINTYIETL